MYGIEFDPQTTSDYWAHYLRVMKEAKTRWAVQTLLGHINAGPGKPASREPNRP